MMPRPGPLRPTPGPRPGRLFLALLILIGACADTETRTERGSGSAAGEPGATEPDPATRYERDIVLMTLGADSAIVVPWSFHARADAAGVQREVSGWISRGEAWESFHADRWTTGPTRAPFRIHPRGPLDLIVGNEDALEAVVYQEGARELETVLETPLTDWRSPTGSTFRIYRGALYMASQRLDARVLDVSRSYRVGGDEPPGDWMYLQSGPELSFVFEQPVEGDTIYGGWALLDAEEDRRWTRIRVGWSERRAYEEARRDIPNAWSIEAPGGGLRGSLRNVAASLQVGEADGPLLPVTGLFRVRGELVLEGDTVVVRGIVRHTQH